MARLGSTCTVAAFSIRRFTSASGGWAGEAGRTRSTPGASVPEMVQWPPGGRRTAPVAHYEPARRRFDQADAAGRQALDRLAAAQERIAALLTDQRTVPARRWWRWR